MIELKDVQYVARLARLRLTDDEQERMLRELDAVLGYIEHIEELDLEGVEPTSHVVDLVNSLRPDEVRAGLTREQALANAPEVADDGFAVPSPGS
ncbi:MAG: Asp-tRNA(Asn)/Glu-tRNA(Gln) amidotransferase subunit GatC [Actinobacteria bacterium]|nr:Asp-tRNA(Asn)/Glu-tRNA(Gln) amidotransferase subunit GatC [Actinomycetota bacterium]